MCISLILGNIIQAISASNLKASHAEIIPNGQLKQTEILGGKRGRRRAGESAGHSICFSTLPRKGISMVSNVEPVCSSQATWKL